MGLTGNQELIQYTSSGPSGSTRGLASSSFDLPLLPFEGPISDITTDFGGALQPGAPPVVSPSDLVLWRGNSTGQPSHEDQRILSVISSTLFPKMPTVPHVPLSFLGEPNIQISYTTPELEMAL